MAKFPLIDRRHLLPGAAPAATAVISGLAGCAPGSSDAAPSYAPTFFSAKEWAFIQAAVTPNRTDPSYDMGDQRLNSRALVTARTAIKAGLVALVMLISLADTVVAGPFDDAKAAYDRGDHATALLIWRPLADQGNATAQYYLGVMYDHGQGVPRNYSAALTWFSRAADQGHVSAQYNLGVMYADGQGVPRDFIAAVTWYRVAAEQGNASAQSSLGVMYALGKGVQQDDAVALTWFRKVADRGHAGAQYNIGVMYADGRAVPQDLAMAVTWYRKAADQGNTSAQSNLGAMYADGRGVPQDYLLAHMWFSLAGSRNALRNRDIAAGHLTPAQIADAERLAREWKMN